MARVTRCPACGTVFRVAPPLLQVPAKAEMTINLELDTADLRPAGFRIDLMAVSPQ
jgi:hypothetical protein